MRMWAVLWKGHYGRVILCFQRHMSTDTDVRLRTVWVLQPRFNHRCFAKLQSYCSTFLVRCIDTLTPVENNIDPDVIVARGHHSLTRLLPAVNATVSVCLPALDQNNIRRKGEVVSEYNQPALFQNQVSSANSNFNEFPRNSGTVGRGMRWGRNPWFPNWIWGQVSIGVVHYTELHHTLNVRVVQSCTIWYVEHGATQV